MKLKSLVNRMSFIYIVTSDSIIIMITTDDINIMIMITLILFYLRNLTGTEHTITSSTNKERYNEHSERRQGI